MKKNLKILSMIVLSLIFVTGCEDRNDLASPSLPDTGSADFSRFVTLGNSLTAGYQNGALYSKGQYNSYGNLIAEHVGAEYAMPLLSGSGSGNRIEIKSLDPFVTAINPEKGTPINYIYKPAYNNLGIPGAFVYDFLNAKDSTTCYSAMAGVTNPLFDIVLREKGTQFEQAKSLNPTILTLWAGSNDVLFHATSGGTLPYTGVAQFGAMYNVLADSIASLDCDVVVANIADVKNAPYFTTVPAALLDKNSNIVPLYGVTKTGTRVLTPGFDLIVLEATSALLDAAGQPTGLGLTEANPIPDNLILDKDEADNLSTVINSYNEIIKTACEARGFAYVDMHSYFLEFTGGKEVDGINFSSKYFTGNMFSLDGLHPTGRGYGLLANEFIKVINEKFDAKIPRINVSTIPQELPLHEEKIAL